MAKRLLGCILALSLLFSLASCEEETPPEQSGSAPGPSLPVVAQPDPVPAPPVEEDKPLTLAFHTEESLHPAQTTSRVNLTLAPLLYEGLFRLDTAFSPQPVLCRSYEVSADGLVWTFDLVEEVTFSDGTALTASLAAQALNLAKSSGGTYAGRFAGVKSIAANRSGRLVITLLQPNSRLPALLDIPIALGKGNRPLGTGPYVLTEEDGVFQLERREDWWQGIPLPEEEISLFPVTGADDLIHGFDGGEITLVNTDPTGTNTLGYSSVCDQTGYGTTALLYLGFNTANSRGVLRTPQARRAVLAALDREEIVSEAYAGYAVAAPLPVHPWSDGYDPELEQSLAPEGEAEELMAQAKLTGKTVTLLVNSENTFKAAAAQRLARQLEDAGLTVVLSRLSWDDYLAALEGGQFDLYLAEVTLTADFDLTPLVGSSGALNYGGWSSADTDALLRAVRTAGEEERGQALQDLCTHLAQEVPVTPLCFKNGAVLSQWGRITGLTPTRGDIFYQLENWSLN